MPSTQLQPERPADLFRPPTHTPSARTSSETSFLWEGIDVHGKPLRGRQQAASKQALRRHLRAQGVIARRIRRESAQLGRRRRISSDDLALFNRQLATLIAAGLPLVQAFDVLGQGHDNPALRELLHAIRQDIAGGHSLAAALAKHPRYFKDLHVKLVAAGEQSGALENLLDKIAAHQQKIAAIQKKVKKALTYPAVVIAAALGITGLLLVYVVPQFEDMYRNFGAELPTFTRWVLDLSALAKSRGWTVVLAVAAVAFTLVRGRRRSYALRRRLDLAALQLPIAGSILRKGCIARSLRTLATTFAAGVPLVEGLESAAGAAGNLVYETAVLSMRDRVATGMPLHRAMQAGGLFPNLAVQMVAVGEESGALDDMAIQVADLYDAQVDDAVDRLGALLEPAIVGVLGILVGGLVAAMYLPVFQMGQIL